jgi:hypothetical protein
MSKKRPGQRKRKQARAAAAKLTNLANVADIAVPTVKRKSIFKQRTPMEYFRKRTKLSREQARKDFRSMTAKQKANWQLRACNKVAVRVYRNAKERLEKQMDKIGDSYNARLSACENKAKQYKKRIRARRQAKNVLKNN